MKAQAIKDEAVKQVINQAVKHLVKAAHAIEAKTGQPVPQLTSDFIVGRENEHWQLTLTRIT